MWNWLGSIFDRIFAVVGAFLFSQIPSFCQQYKGILSGHFSELTYHINALEQSAKVTGKTIHQLIAKFVDSTDVDFATQGVLMKSTLVRWTQFGEALKDLEGEGISRPFILLKHIDWSLVKETTNQYQFSFALNFEGIFYAMFGMLAGYLTYQVLVRFGKLFVPRKIKEV